MWGGGLGKILSMLHDGYFVNDTTYQNVVPYTIYSDISRDVTGTVGHCFTGAHGWQKAR